jgi:uncharacterized Ntn-hydrolase superfamily protein
MKTGPLAHTYSIAARDPETGCFGVAVQSHWFSVASVAWVEAGVGAIATQAMAEISYGPLGLDLLRAGKSAAQALSALTSVDAEKDLRQVAIVDALGNAATHTGARCIAEAGHVTGDGFSVQANMMLQDTVWPAMDEAYRYAKGSFAERLVATLEAAQACGGDIRGKQSACIKIAAAQPVKQPWTGILVDLRVEDAPEPVAELRRLVQIQHAYQDMNRGDEYLGKGEIEQALEAYRGAAAIAPEISEIPFWHALALLEMGRVDEALPILAPIFQAEPNWALLLERLPASGLLRTDPDTLRRVRALVPVQP